MSGRTGGELVCAALRAAGVTHVFGIASIHNLPILEALRACPEMTVVNVRHEQAAVHAADGYYRATGRLGVALTSTGPGAANAMGALFEAAFASSAVLMLTGQVETRFLGQGRAYIHEAEQQQAMLRTVTKETWSVRRMEDVGDAVADAARTALSGRPRPTAVEIPIDLQYGTTTVESGPLRDVIPTEPQEDRLAAAAELLRDARRPLIWAGGGVVNADAGEALRRLVDRLGIPVVTSTQGRGSLPEDHPLCLGARASAPDVRAVVEAADVVLAIGTRFQMYPTDFWQLKLPSRLIHADVDPSVFGRSYPAAVAVVGDAAVVLEQLDARLRSTAAEEDWAKRARAAAEASVRAAYESIGPDYSAIVRAIREHLPRGGAVVRDSTVPAYYWGDSLLPILEPRTSMNPVSAAIGPGLPLALGAAIGRGERSVVIHGDGGIMLTIGELATAAQFDVPLTVCVFNDRGYGILRGIQGATFGGDLHDVDLTTPDFVTLAESMHVPAERVVDASGFEEAFRRSVEARGPYLIEVEMEALEPMGIAIGPQEILG